MLIKILRAAVSVPVNCNRQAETATLLERLVKSVTEENESEALHLCGPANPEAPKPLLPETLEPCCRVVGSQQYSPETQTSPIMSTSIRNHLPGTIDQIVSDRVVSEIVIKTAAGLVTSIITTGSVKRMNLKKGDAVFAIIKATEVSVEK